MALRQAREEGEIHDIKYKRSESQTKVGVEIEARKKKLRVEWDLYSSSAIIIALAVVVVVVVFVENRREKNMNANWILDDPFGQNDVKYGQWESYSTTTKYPKIFSIFTDNNRTTKAMPNKKSGVLDGNAGYLEAINVRTAFVFGGIVYDHWMYQTNKNNQSLSFLTPSIAIL